MRGIQMFADLSFAELNRLDALLSSKSKEKGDYLFHAGDQANELFIVRSGKVKLNMHGAAGHELIRDILCTGQLAGAEALVGQHRYTAHAVTITGVCLFTLPLPDLHAMMDSNPRFALAVHKQVNLTSMRQCRRMESLILSDARKRLLNLIAELVETDGKVLIDGSVLIRHGLTHNDIGGLTATSRQTITTLMNELRAERLINFDRLSILLHEPKRLGK